MISSFSGKYDFLSNFYHSPFITPKGTLVQTVEHGFHAAKTFDPVEQKRVLEAKTPGIAKRLGRKVKLRPQWNTVRLSIMHTMVKLKFSQNPALKTKLLATGTEKLIEGNTWGDTFWGICKGKGQNHLGHILMEVRNELRE